MVLQQLNKALADGARGAEDADPQLLRRRRHRG